jgi:hypothetical protein
VPLWTPLLDRRVHYFSQGDRTDEVHLSLYRDPPSTLSNLSVERGGEGRRDRSPPARFVRGSCTVGYDCMNYLLTYLLSSHLGNRTHTRQVTGDRAPDRSGMNYHTNYNLNFYFCSEVEVGVRVRVLLRTSNSNLELTIITRCLARSHPSRSFAPP